ncbi:18224_t:CDS:1, partial [Funneliformis geosporum]
RPNPKEPLHPIPVEQPFDRVEIDYVGPLSRITKENQYIIVTTEYLIK